MTNKTKSLENLYDLLEISPKASEEVLRAAHKALMLKHHPDRSGGNENLTQQISEAFNVLKDRKTRERYDKNFRDAGGEVVGEYRILSTIAEGGFGRTYKAKHILTGKLVCIKHCHNLDEFDEEILIEEAQIMWDLRHHYIPAVHGMLRMPDRKLALVMSYIKGPTLAQVVERQIELGKRLDPVHVSWIGERSLNALRYIHHEGVVHGDLKPQNIIVEQDGDDNFTHDASVIDFGLSKLKPKAKSGNKGFTEIFSAPEILANPDNTILPEADFYSLGMTMIYALTGDIDCLLRKEVPNDTPPAFQNFIRKLIVRDPLSRPRWPKNPTEHDLWDEFVKVRQESFGQRHSGLKPIPGF